MKVIVIGAGIIGASIAFRMAEAGAQVTLVEAHRVGSGTSSTSYAWVNACEKLTSRAYFDLNFAGVKAHRRLAGEIEGANWLHRPGVVQWKDAGAEAAGFDEGNFDKLERLKSWGYPADAITAETLARLEPDVDLSTFTETGAIHYPEDGWLDSPVYAGAIVARAQRRHELRLLTGTKVARLLVRNGKAAGVVLNDGTEIEADRVVNSAGRWSNEAVGAAEHELPLAPTVGLIAYTASSDTSLRHALRTPLVNCRPDGAGRILLRANDIDKTLAFDTPATPDNPAAQELLSRMIRLMPSLTGLHVEAVRTAIRPIPKDGLSAIGPHPALDNYYVTVTHSGVTLGAFIGEAVRDELLHGRSVPELAEFRPARFF
ncbi:NAD(P)/FAD-dependent oxidoreductase [Pelagovum pacificum]|uniref:FAD-binding oxidoreductase n=1 Tax=Pelagovum pacificum TaxID=2588711 RepID=A0A5C5GDJ9_9RHOB|nr:FAD-binding oxidoreductase [Pelagovum pacificum]QQA44310.1 FAD-binding oxidoreductase [Pelagovum pacificum]TNY32570.1 FAD-binding oxidoreductase [Pelagovum pacificum]